MVKKTVLVDMDVPHPLQSILQSFLVSDASAVLFAPQVLERLSSSCLAPSSHLQKWCTRITSLIHSKDPGARWAGICFAYRTSALSEQLLIEHARSWIGIVLPLLSKPEPKPILKVSMRYLRLVLGAAAGHPEFQRQVAAPAVPKISAALLHIAENSIDTNLRALATQVLSQLVMSYPSQHRALSSKLFALCYGIFGGSSPQPTDARLLDVTADLFSTLHYLGGKVGGVNTWRSCLDAVLYASWVAWAALRTTFPSSMTHLSGQTLNMEGTTPSYFGPLPGDPLTANLLCLDRLNCNITAICALLRAPVQRPVKVPIGNLVAFSCALLACTDEEQQSERLLNPQVRALEVGALPQIWMHGCRLLSCLCQVAQKLVAPSASRIVTIIACQLERIQENSRRSAFLQIAHDILSHCSVVGSSIAVTRLMRTTIASLSQLYLPQSAQGGDASSQKTGKKRVRDFQDGDALSTRQQVLCATSDSCNAILVALDVIHEGLKNMELPLQVRSLSTRVLLSLLLSLPSTPPQSLSYDLNVYNQLVKRVREICLDNAVGTSEMSRFVGLVLRCCAVEGGLDPASLAKLQSSVDLLIHPRRPPPSQRLPSLEFLLLSSAEESKDQAAARQAHGLSGHSGTVEGTSPVVLEKIGEPARVLSLVQERSPAPPLKPDRSTDISPPNLSPSTDSVPESHDISMVTHTRSHPSPPRVQPLPAIQRQEQPPKPIITVPVTLIADEDNEEVPSIDMDSDSDA